MNIDITEKQDGIRARYEMCNRACLAFVRDDHKVNSNGDLGICRRGDGLRYGEESNSM